MCRYLAAATPPTAPNSKPRAHHHHHPLSHQELHSLARHGGGVSSSPACVVWCVSQSFGSPGACSALSPPGGIHIRRGVNSDVWLVASLGRPSSPSRQSHCSQLRNHHHHFHEAAILLALRKPRSPRIPPRDSRHWVDAQEVIFHRATTPRRPPSRGSNPNKASSPQTPSSHLFPPLPTSSPPSVATPKKGCQHHHHPSPSPVRHIPTPRVVVNFKCRQYPPPPPGAPSGRRARTLSSVSALSSHARPPWLSSSGAPSTAWEA